jgi:hypothetical protein
MLIDPLEFAPPLEINGQYSILWNYRMALAVIAKLKRLLDEEKLRRDQADQARTAMGDELQKWISETKIKKTT